MMESTGEPVTARGGSRLSLSLHADFEPTATTNNNRSQAASIISLRLPQPSVPNTAATSMLTVCQDEKDGVIGETGVNDEAEENTCAREGAPPEPQVYLTFLLVTGSRKTMAFNPETTIGRVKELVWNAWPTDWTDEKPTGPNFLRVLYLGKILQDEDTLIGLSLPTSPTSPVSIPGARTSHGAPHSTIVHLSIRPYAPLIVEDEALLKKNFRAARRALSRSGSTPTPPPTSNTQAGDAAADEARRGSCCGCIIC